MSISTGDSIQSTPGHFTASVAQVKTLADGGIRLTLDLPETAISTAAAMMQARQAGAVIEVSWLAVLPGEQKEKPDYGL